jgi:hypothetical protein
MQEIIVALFALGIGILFSFYGYKAMRLLLPLWGLVAGYWLGAELVNAITGDGFFGTALSIAVGVAFALVGAALAYLFYAAAIVIFMGMIGYWLGAGLLIAAGVDPGFITALVGVATGVVLAGFSLRVRAPKYFLLFFTALAGAALMVSGLLLLGNVVDLAAFKQGPVNLVTEQTWIWQVLWLGVAAVGLTTQLVNSENEEALWLNEWEAGK